MADDAWLIDCVVQFLRSPIWQMPIMGFIDLQCLVFDQDEENELTYTEIHREYQKLVEFMLESFVKDIGIKSEDFVKACKKRQHQLNASIMTLFEQIEAASDFEIFKRMMIRQNVELELQALRILQARHGIVPDIMLAQQDDNTSARSEDENEDDKILNEILRKSKEEYEALKKQGKEREAGSDAMMERALAKSEEEAQRLKSEMEKEDDMFNKALNLSLSNKSPRTAAETTPSLPPLALRSETRSSTSESKSTAKSSTASSTKQLASATPEAKATPVASATPEAKATPLASATATPVAKAAPIKRTVSGAEAAANWLSSAKAEAAASEGRTSQTNVQSSEAVEMKKRAEYLKKQRDILIEMKRKEREKNFQKETESQSKAASRPKSARAARQVTSGEVKPDSASSAEQDKKLKMRLALADRLKKEVIGEM